MKIPMEKGEGTGSGGIKKKGKEIGRIGMTKEGRTEEDKKKMRGAMKLMKRKEMAQTL